MTLLKFIGIVLWVVFVLVMFKMFMWGIFIFLWILKMLFVGIVVATIGFGWYSFKSKSK